MADVKRIVLTPLEADTLRADVAQLFAAQETVRKILGYIEGWHEVKFDQDDFVKEVVGWEAPPITDQDILELLDGARFGGPLFGEEFAFPDDEHQP